MTTTPSSEARQEAELRYPENEPAYSGRGMISREVRDQREAFEEGAEWKGAQDEALIQAAVTWYARRHEAIHAPPGEYDQLESAWDRAGDRLADAIFPYWIASGVESSDEGEADGE
jgi:hypothetical protein